MNKLFYYIGRFFDLHILGTVCVMLTANFVWMANTGHPAMAVGSIITAIVFLYFYKQELIKDRMKETQKMTHRFYKEANGVWYIDLPEFLNAGLGTKANLMMVAGADTFLDKLSNNGNDVTVHIETAPYAEQEYALEKIGMGKDQELLDAVGHAPVPYGAYYQAQEDGHIMWLCPVTEYVFGGGYPDNIYINVVK